mmetsp:Transcript_8014/g.13453  ORF Transcript_8014/g.13453 Transcript_8014/m.13453 type:complete len:85 (-) Transcript_8014:93-347(-)
MTAPGKEQEKEKLLGQTVLELLEMESEDLESDKDDQKYVDLTITCCLKGGEQGQILEGVPPLRVMLSTTVSSKEEAKEEEKKAE